MDLSGVFLGDVQLDIDDLEDMLWDRRTVWPRRELADQDRARSDEIRPGLYRVRLGCADYASVR